MDEANPPAEEAIWEMEGSQTSGATTRRKNCKPPPPPLPLSRRRPSQPYTHASSKRGKSNRPSLYQRISLKRTRTIGIGIHTPRSTAG